MRVIFVEHANYPPAQCMAGRAGYTSFPLLKQTPNKATPFPPRPFGRARFYSSPDSGSPHHSPAFVPSAR